jgi:hypothetical protein
MKKAFLVIAMLLMILFEFSILEKAKAEVAGGDISYEVSR